MADQNSSGRRPMNSVADDIDYSSTLTELERIGARAGRKSIQRSELEDRIRSEGKLLNRLVEEGRRTPIIREGGFYDSQVSGLRDSIRSIRGRMNSLDSAASSRAEAEASTYISRQFSQSTINGQTAGMQREASIQNRAFSMMGQTYDELNSRREDVLADIRLRERGALNEVKGMYSGRGQVDPERSAALGVMMSGVQGSFRDLATINAAQTLQRTSGTDPSSRLRRLGEMGNTAGQILSAESIAREVQSGGVNISSGGGMRNIGNDDIGGEIINQARALSQALKELSEGANKTDEELSKLRATADESADNLDKLQKAQGMGGGGGRGTIMGYLGAAGGAFNAMGGAAQQILVNQRLQDVGNVGGFAGLANQQYGMYQKARGGDIASQLALGSFDDAGGFGSSLATGTRIAQSAYMVAGAAQAGAGAMQAGEGLKNASTLGFLNSGVGNNLAQGASNVVQGGATMAVTGADMLRGTSAASAQLAGINAQMSARMAINQVGASQAQGLRDFMTGLDVVGQGMGGRASSFIQNSISGGNMDAMMAARLSPEQFMQMSQMGVEGMGSTFNSSQVFASRNLERGGFGSMGTNMARMSSLASAGANNPQAGLESVLSSAVSKGLDSSKAITMMVENTASMVSSSAGAAVGIDTVGASSSLLASSMNPNIANKEFALQQAMSAQEITRAATTNADVSFTGMSNTAGLQAALGKQGINIGGGGAISLQKVDMQTLKSLQNDPKAAAAFFQNRGINISENNASNAIDTIMDEKAAQIIKPASLAQGLNANSMAQKMRAGTLTAEEKRLLGQGAVFSGRTGFDELQREVMGAGASPTGGGVGASLTAGGGANDLKGQMDQLRTSGFKQLTEAASSASKDLEKFGGALKVFADLQSKFESGGVDNEKNFSSAASKMATEFSASTGMFSKSVTDFEKAVRVLSSSAGLNNTTMPNTDFLNQRKGSGG